MRALTRFVTNGRTDAQHFYVPPALHLYEACDQISDFCHQQLLRKMRRKISWTDGRTLMCHPLSDMVHCGTIFENLILTLIDLSTEHSVDRSVYSTFCTDKVFVNVEQCLYTFILCFKQKQFSWHLF